MAAGLAPGEPGSGAQVKRMKRTVIILACVALGACSRPAPQSAPGAAAQGKAPAPAATTSQPKDTQPMPAQTRFPTIKAEALQEAAEEGVVALVKVTRAALQNPGTRSESVQIDAEIVTSIRGASPKPLVMRRFTSKGDPVLETGKQYVVAAVPDQRSEAMQLIGFVPVPPGQEQAAVEAHRGAIESKR